MKLISSSIEFDNAISDVAEALYNLLKNDSPTSTVKRGGYLYQDFTYSQTDNGKPQICSVIYGKMAKAAKLNYLNKIQFVVS